MKKDTIIKIIQQKIAAEFYKNTYTPMILGILTAILFLIFVEYSFRTGIYTVIPEKYLSASAQNDYSIHPSYLLGKIKNEPQNSKVIYIFGSSTGRSDFTGDLISEYISKYVNENINCYNLSLHNASFLRDWAIFNNIPPPSDDAYIILTIGTTRFFYSPKYVFTRGNEPFIVNSTYVESFENKIRYSLILTPVSNKFLLYIKNNYNLLLNGELPARSTPENYGFRGVSTKARVEAAVTRWETNRRDFYFANLEENLILFSEFLDAIRAGGFKAVTVALPVNKELLGNQWDNTLFSFNQRARDICLQKNVPYIDYLSTLTLPRKYFNDLWHLNPTGRQYFNERFSADLAALILKDKGADSTLVLPGTTR